MPDNQDPLVSLFSRSVTQLARGLPSISGPPVRRTPFMFTSTKRLLSTNTGDVITRTHAKMDAHSRLKFLLDRIEANGNPAAKAPNAQAQAAVIAATQRSAYISMMVNPNTIKWNQTKRFTKRDTMGGSTYFHFTNKNGQNEDILSMQFSGTTGNIKSDGVSPDALVSASLKLKVWHELYALSREPILLPNGIRNEFFITYKTVLIPYPITLIGFFNTPLDFTETANQPFMRDYSFGFTVTNTSPDLDKLVEKINSALYPSPNPTTFGAR